MTLDIFVIPAPEPESIAHPVIPAPEPESIPHPVIPALEPESIAHPVIPALEPESKVYLSYWCDRQERCTWKCDQGKSLWGEYQKRVRRSVVTVGLELCREQQPSWRV